MLASRRREKESASRSESNSRAGDGTFTYKGVDGNFTLYSVNDFRNNNVKIYISYWTSDVPWLDRSEWESGVLNYLKKQLTQYCIVDYRFVRRDY